MESWDDWDDFLKGIAFDHKLTVEQQAVFFVRLSRLSIDEKRTNQDIANEVIGGEPHTALSAYDKRMKEVFHKLSLSFPEINAESRGKVERTQACLEQVYLEQQNKKKFEAASHAIAPPDWHKICRKMLEDQKQNLRRQVTQMGFELNVFVPLGLVDRKQQARRSSDFSLPPEQGSNFFQLSEEEIIKTYEHDEFLEQIIQQGQSKKSQGKRIAIIGEPGAGKTTLLEAISLTACCANAFSPKTPGFPIWVSLGSLGDRSLEEYLYQKWLKDALKTSDVTQQQKELEELFKSGQVLLLLDGVDEMPAPSPVEALAKIREELTGWVADARVVLTCRVNVWDACVNALQGFDTYRTLEFSYGDGNKPDQVREFICQWFSKAEKPELGEPLREKLDEDRHQRIRDLVKNPMRLSLLCQSWYFCQGDLPKTKASLYEQFTQAFYDWKEEQFPTTPTQRKELNAALGLLAREAIDKEKFRFGIRESFALDLMGEDLFSLACKLHWLNFVYKDADTGEKVYAFFHPTFQEYFAACAIEDWDYFLTHNNENPNPFLKYNNKDCVYRIFEQQWKEVFLLWMDQEKVPKEQKNDLLWALVEFKDGCNDMMLDPPWKDVILRYVTLESLTKERKDESLRALMEFKEACNDFCLYWKQAYNLAYEGICHDNIHHDELELGKILYIDEDGATSKIDVLIPQYQKLFLGFPSFIERLDTRQYQDIYQSIAFIFKQVAPNDFKEENPLSHLLRTNPAKVTRQTVVESLSVISRKDNLFLKTIVSVLKNYIESNPNSNANLHDFCHCILWECAQIMPYPDYYHAWHNSLRVTNVEAKVR
jgi:predicted NACHT family NTPase